MAIWFDYAEKTHCIEFSYEKDNEGYSLGTHVRLLLKDPSTNLFRELCRDASFCHPNDNFNKEYGRKLALERVLDLFTETALEDGATAAECRTFRTAAWNAYHNRKNMVQKSIRGME